MFRLYQIKNNLTGANEKVSNFFEMLYNKSVTELKETSDKATYCPFCEPPETHRIFERYGIQVNLCPKHREELKEKPEIIQNSRVVPAK
jgi:hypothetical protein